MAVCRRKPSYALAMSEGPSHVVLISCVGCTKTLQSGVALPGGPGPSEVRPPRGLMKWYPLVICYIASEHGQVEIVDLPTEKGDVPYSFSCMFTGG